jgi:cytochrome c peroxidase
MKSRSSLECAWIVASLVVLASASGCVDEGASSVRGLFTEAQWEIVESLADVQPVPPDSTNRFADDPAAAALGQKLFFEGRYSGPLTVGDDGSNGALGAEGDTGRVSCSSCHIPESDFADSRSKPGNTSIGAGITGRNAPSLINVAYYDWHGWGGKQDSLWTQASLSPESSDNTGGTRCGYSHVVFDHYRTEYEALFGPMPAALAADAADAGRFPAECKPKKAPEDPDGAWEAMDPADQEAINQIMANCGKSIAAYERLLVSFDAPFDQFVAGDDAAISASAKRGLKLFVGKAGCVDCHEGPTFSDNDFHVTGVAQVGPNVPETDEGRFKDIGSVLKHQFNTASAYSDDPAAGQEKLGSLTATDDDLGAFRTKALRNVANSAPYFHTGELATLADVVDFYDRGGEDTGFMGTKDARLVPLNLTSQEREDLVAFLESITGQPVPAELLANTSNP